MFRTPGAVRGRRIAALLGAAITAVSLTSPGSSASASTTPRANDDPTALVNPFIGTGTGGQHVGQVDAFPGATAPFGMLSLSPETASRPPGSGYAYADTSITGFSLTHVSGAGCALAGDVPILPSVGAIGGNPGAATEPFQHSDEQARPGYYATKLGAPGQQISAQVSATSRTGISRFGFPTEHQANLLFKAGDSQNPNTAADVHVLDSNTMSGSATGGGFCGNPQVPAPVYFVAEFDHPVRSYGTWDGGAVHPGTASASARPAGQQPATSDHGQAGGSTGAWVSFGDSPGPVDMKVAISYVSTADAWQNLKAEDAGWDVDAVAAQTGHDWQMLLSRIQIAGGTHRQRVSFYSALYHALLAPTVDSDVNGDYAGFDRKVHRVPAGRAHYSNYSGWDIYRSEIPLLALLVPERTSQMMQSLVDDAQQGGWLPKWPVNSSYSGVMEGDPADAMIAEAYEFGARDFDTHAALDAMIKGATQVPDSQHLGQGWYEERPQLSDYLRLGYVPNGPGAQSTTGASLTLEYATADFAISRFASALGQPGTAKNFLDRSQNWTHLYNPGSGYLQPRDIHGAFPTGNPVTTGPIDDSGQSGFREGTAAQYAFSVPQNLPGLIAAKGGNAAVNQWLDQFFTELNAGPMSPHYWAGNETDLLIPWVYDYTGQPYRTATTVHRLLNSVYSDTPDGEPGNDDLGALSSWYVLSALGLYPITPGTGVLATTTPLFPHAELQLPHGRVTITAPGTSDTNLHVRSMTVNGQPNPRDWIDVSDLLGRDPARVDFALTSHVAPSWATSPGDGPPS